MPCKGGGVGLYLNNNENKLKDFKQRNNMINEVFWKDPFRYITEKKLRVLVQRTKLKAGRPAGRLQNPGEQ